MEQLLETLRSLGNHQSRLDDQHGYAQTVRTKSDVITQLASAAIPSDRPFHNSTHILQYLSEPQFIASNTTFSLILLHLQSNILTDASCAIPFLKACKILALHVPPMIAQQFCREGNCFCKMNIMHNFNHCIFPIVFDITAVIAKVACASNTAAATIRTLRRFIELTYPIKTILTPIHTSFLQVSVSLLFFIFR